MCSSDLYGELVKAANSLGMKIVPLDMPIEMMDEPSMCLTVST